MKLKYIFAALTITAGFVASCDKEDAVTPNVKDTSFYFAPNDTCTDEESEIRRDFFKKHGSYLLFNDTIQHIYVGNDINGNPAYFTEVLDLSYSIGDVNSNNTKVTYTLLTNITRKKEAVEFMEKEILYHFTKDLQPFSWLLANKINKKYINEITNPTAMVGQRAIAVSMYNLPRLRTEEQRQSYISQILVAIIDNVVKNRVSLFGDFYKVSQSLYSMNYTGYEDATAAECLAYLNTKGFLSRGKDSTWGTANNTTYPNRETDIGDYSRLVAINSIEEIETKYATCPIVIQKAKIMREVLTSIGYVFEKEKK